MLKPLTRLTLAALAASLCATTAAAQTTPEWIVLSPADGEFTARMPKRPTTSAASAEAGGAGGGAAVDYDRPRRQNEVTKKAVFTSKPAPGFTEQARRFNVTGTVRLRAILSADGEIRSLTAVRGLPHGLTEKAIEAARRIEFEPAQKDGRAVAQYAIIEYKFNIY